MKINTQSTNNPARKNVASNVATPGNNNNNARQSRAAGSLGNDNSGASGSVNQTNVNSKNNQTNRQASPQSTSAQSAGYSILGNMLNPFGHLNYIAHTNPIQQLNPLNQINPLNKITASKYSGEHHAISLDPRHFGEGYTFAGPGTNLTKREQLHDNVPLNSLDAAAKEHDYAYMKEATDYSRDNNKSKHMENVWNADKQFMNKSFLNKDDPIMGTVAAGMIGAKMMGEKLGLLDTKRFSGIRETSSSPETKVHAGKTR